ncbi:hypothetical protein MOC16_gp264 [Klebsiella phage vB_KpM_FBKp24]|uniref:Uncharacterized protein n=1 Tax=Klebsiella phage vB_KpM_FBKp24 TaxID=2801834 RepID=A0A7U0J5K3_9CAUD|nr:hypothetical protein MOC16_gp264 [Klebsiella phage vB_KpM_FBKp24]QQV92338.1 hypothetical protein vBKpMFBKp24_149 [Klebsiella phage vB_KpM_FBKp24]
MDKDYQIFLAKESLCDLVNETQIDKEALPLPLPTARYDLLVMGKRIGADTSTISGFHLLADNDTARELRELIY